MGAPFFMLFFAKFYASYQFNFFWYICLMRMDKTIFTKQSFEEASNHKKIYDSMEASDKSLAFYVLMSAAFDFVDQPWPKMDKTIFSKRKHDV